MKDISYTICSLSLMQSRLYFDLLDGEDQGVRVYTHPIAILITKLFQKAEKVDLGNCTVYVNKRSFADWFAKTLTQKKLDQTSVNEGKIEDKIKWLYANYFQKDKLVLTNFSSSDHSLENSPFYYLPKEIFFLITSYLNVKEVNTLGMSCKKLNVLTADHTIWKKFYLQRFPFTTQAVDVGVNWKKKYLLDVYPWKQKPTLSRIYHVFGYSQQGNKRFDLSRRVASSGVLGYVYDQQTINCMTHEVKSLGTVCYQTEMELDRAKETARKKAELEHPDPSDRTILVKLGLANETTCYDYNCYFNEKFLALKDSFNPNTFGIIQIWDLQTRHLKVNLKIREDFETFLPSHFKLFESLLVVFDQERVKVWNLASPSFSLIFDQHMKSHSIIEVAADDRHLAVVTPQTLFVYDLGLKKQIYEEDFPMEGGVLVKQIDVIGNQIVATFQNKHVLYIWKFPTLAS